jgi:hypothetical protein
MSACMRSLYSPDQWAPDFCLLLSCVREMETVLLSLGDFRAPIFNLSVARGDVGLEDEFELFMELLGTYFGFVTLLALALNWITREILDIGYDIFTSYDEPPSRVGQGRGLLTG